MTKLQINIEQINALDNNELHYERESPKIKAKDDNKRKEKRASVRISIINSHEQY